MTPKHSPSTRQQSPLTAKQPAFTCKQLPLTAKQSPRTSKQCPQTLEKTTVAAAQWPRTACQWPETADSLTNRNNRMRLTKHIRTSRLNLGWARVGLPGSPITGWRMKCAKSLWKHDDSRYYGLKSRKNIWVILYDVHLGSTSGFTAIIGRGRNAGRWRGTANRRNKAGRCRADWFAAESSFAGPCWPE